MFEQIGPNMIMTNCVFNRSIPSPPEISGGWTELGSYVCSGCTHTMQGLYEVQLPRCSRPAHACTRCNHISFWVHIWPLHQYWSGCMAKQQSLEDVCTILYSITLFSCMLMLKETIEAILKPFFWFKPDVLNEMRWYQRTWPWTPEPTWGVPPHVSQKCQMRSACAPSKLWRGLPGSESLRERGEDADGGRSPVHHSPEFLPEVVCQQYDEMMTQGNMFIINRYY